MTTTSQTTNLTIRIDKKLKADAETFFDDLGLNISTAFNIFLKKCLREDRIPFEISREKEEIPNRTTRQAMRQAEKAAKNPKTKTYYNLEELFNDLDKEIKNA